MVIDPARKTYNDGVRALVTTVLNLSEGEVAAQENQWIRRVESGEFCNENFFQFLRSKMHDGYKARLIAIALAPEGLTPFVWTEQVPRIKIDTHIDYFSPRLRKYVERLREFNASFNTTCV